MRKAVIRIDADPDHKLSARDVADGVRTLETWGFTVRRRRHDRDLTVTFDSPDRETARDLAVSFCEKAFGVTPAPGAVTFASRGTDEDALGVIAAFGVPADLERVEDNGEEIIVATFSAADRKRVPESRLHTALEAALNCEIRIRYA